MDEIDTAFENIVLSENRAEEEGFAEGFRDGQTRGYRDGHSLGLQHGSSLGSELGFYAGFVAAHQVLESAREKPRARLIKKLEALQELLRDFPQLSPQDERIQELIMNIRAKVKQGQMALQSQQKLQRECIPKLMLLQL